MRERRHRCGWAKEHIPLVEELLPGDDRLVAPVQRVKVLCQGYRRFLAAGLDGPDRHADQRSRPRQFLVEIERRQRPLIDGTTDRSKPLGQL